MPSLKDYVNKIRLGTKQGRQDLTKEPNREGRIKPGSQTGKTGFDLVRKSSSKNVLYQQIAGSKRQKRESLGREIHT